MAMVVNEKSQEAALEATAPLVLPPPQYADQQEQAWKDALTNLDNQIALYKNARSGHEPDVTSQREQQVYDAMNNVADAHTDPRVRAHWRARAEEFRNTDDAGKDNLLKDLMKAIATLIALPFVLSGIILCGAGKILRGIGTALTTGRVRREKKGLVK